MAMTVADVLPPGPAKTPPTRMKHLAESLIRDEPNRHKIPLTVLADKAREMV